MTGLHVTAGDFNRKPGYYQDQTKNGPVVISRNGREQAVLINVEEYQKLLQSYRETMLMSELPIEYAHLLANSKMDAKHDHLNTELEG